MKKPFFLIFLLLICTIHLAFGQSDSLLYTKIGAYVQQHYPACATNIIFERADGFMVRCSIKEHAPDMEVNERTVVKTSNLDTELTQPEQEMSIWREISFMPNGDWRNTTTILRDIDCTQLGEADCHALARARLYCRETLKKAVLGTMRIVEEASGNRYFTLSTISGDLQFDATGKILSPTKP